MDQKNGNMICRLVKAEVQLFEGQLYMTHQVVTQVTMITRVTPDALKPGLLGFFNCQVTPVIWPGYQVVTTTGEQVKTYNSKKKSF